MFARTAFIGGFTRDDRVQNRVRTIACHGKRSLPVLPAPNRRSILRRGQTRPFDRGLREVFHARGERNPHIAFGAEGRAHHRGHALLLQQRQAPLGRVFDSLAAVVAAQVLADIDERVKRARPFRGN